MLTIHEGINHDNLHADVVCDDPSLPMLEIALRSETGRAISYVFFTKEQAEVLVADLQRKLSEL